METPKPARALDDGLPTRGERIAITVSILAVFLGLLTVIPAIGAFIALTALDRFAPNLISDADLLGLSVRIGVASFALEMFPAFVWAPRFAWRGIRDLVATGDAPEVPPPPPTTLQRVSAELVSILAIVIVLRTELRAAALLVAAAVIWGVTFGIWFLLRRIRWSRQQAPSPTPR